MALSLFIKKDKPKAIIIKDNKEILAFSKPFVVDKNNNASAIINLNSLQDIEEERTLEDSLRLRDTLLKSDDDLKRKIAATTRDPLLQNTLFKLKEPEILYRLASNKFLDETIQYIIATEEEYNILNLRVVLAAKIGTSLNVLKVLARSEDVSVRIAMVSWQRPINPTIAKILLDDPDVEVRKILAIHIGESISHQNIISFKGNVEEIQEMIIKDQDILVRSEMAKNKMLKPKVQSLFIEECFKKKDFKVLAILAKNESLNKESQILICQKCKMYNENAFEIKLIMKNLILNPSFDKSFL
jgi:hypothetical protein